MCWISAIVDVSSGHGAGTASYVNVDISTFVIRLMKYWEFHESMSQSANPPTSQIGIRCSRAKKCSEGALKVLHEMLLYVGGWGIFCFAELWFAETLNSRDTEYPRQRLDESKPSGGRYWKCVNFYSWRSIYHEIEGRWETVCNCRLNMVPQDEIATSTYTGDFGKRLYVIHMTLCGNINHDSCSRIVPK